MRGVAKKAFMNDVTATPHPAQAQLSDNLMDAAHRSGHFKHLMAAIRATGLGELLTGVGPFTLYVPNDKAFDRLARNELTDLLKPESKAKLTALLKLHIVPGLVRAPLAGDAPRLLTSLQGDALTVDTAQGLRVNGARLIERDIEATNGILHGIDTVLRPAAG